MANLKDLIVNGSARILGTLYANVTGNATTATTATKIKVTDHSANNATYYPVWVTGAGASVDAYNTTSKLKFNPSTGVLTSTSFAGNVTGGTGSFTSNAFGTALSVTRTNNTSGAMAIKFINASTLKGYLGLNAGGLPTYWNSSTTEQRLLRQETVNTEVGSATKPVYINADGVAQACGTSLAVSVTGNAATATVLQDMNRQPQGSLTNVSGNITIALTRQQMLYRIKPTANITGITLNTTAANLNASYAYTFELIIDMTAGAYTVSIPDSLCKWEGNNKPTINEQKMYMLVFRTMDAGTTWYGSLQGAW